MEQIRAASEGALLDSFCEHFEFRNSTCWILHCIAGGIDSRSEIPFLTTLAFIRPSDEVLRYDNTMYILHVDFRPLSFPSHRQLHTEASATSARVAFDLFDRDGVAVETCSVSSVDFASTRRYAGFGGSRGASSASSAFACRSSVGRSSLIMFVGASDQFNMRYIARLNSVPDSPIIPSCLDPYLYFDLLISMSLRCALSWFMPE